MELVQTVISNPWVVEAMKVPNFLGILLALIIYRFVCPVIDLFHPVSLIIGFFNFGRKFVANRRRPSYDRPPVVPEAPVVAPANDIGQHDQ